MKKKEDIQNLEFFKFSLDRTRDALFWMDSDANIIYVNDAAAKLLGYSKSQLLKMRVFDFDHSLNKSNWQEFWSELKKLKTVKSEFIHITKNGKKLPVEVSANYTIYNGKELNCAFARDISDKKTDLENISKYKKRLDNLFASVWEGIGLVDEHEIIQYCNPAFAELLDEKSENVVIGKNFLEYVERDKIPFIKKQTRQRVKGKSSKYELEIKTAENKKKILRISVTPSYDEQGEFDYSIAAIVDITDLKESEKKIKESETRFRNLVETTSDWIWETNANNEYIYAGPNIEDLLGYTPGEVIGKTPFDLMNPKEADRIKEIFNKYVQQKLPFDNLININKHKNGHLVILESSGVPLFNDNKDFKGYRGIDRDITTRYNYERVLLDSERRLEETNIMLRNILDTIPVRVFWKDVNSKYLGCNRIFARDAGFENPDDIIGKNDFDMGWKNEAELYRKDDKHVINTGKEKLNYEEPQTTPDGNKIWLKTSKIPLMDINHNIIGVLGTYDDITEKKEAELNLYKRTREKEKMFESARHLTETLELNAVLKKIVKGMTGLLNTESFTIYLLDESKKLLDPVIVIDPQFEEELKNAPLDVENSLTGKVVKAKKGLIFNVTTREVGAYHIPGTPDDLKERLLVVPLSVNEVVIGAICLSRFDFDYTQEELNIAEAFAAYASIAIKNAQIYDALQKEIEDHKKTERSLNELNLQYKSFIDNNMVGIWRLGFSKKIKTNRPALSVAKDLLNYGYFTDCNEAFAEMYGFESKDDMIGKKNKDFMVNYERSLERLISFVDSGYRIESIISEEKDKSGHTRKFQNSYFGIIDNKELKWIWGIQVDITERIQLEEELRQAQKMEAVGKLAGGIAHDFNNLLTVIKGHAEIGKMKINEDSPINKDLNSIFNASVRAEDLTSQLLAFGRKQIIEPQILDVNYVINNLHSIISRLISEDIQIHWDFAPDLKPIKADKGQFEQIIINLVINARDAIYSNKKSSEKIISIKTDKLLIKDDEEHKSGLGAGFYNLIEIQDTGTGIPDEIQNQIFEPFFTTKERGKGTGLGLSTVYGILKQNMGHITIESEVGKGTIFRIFWPVEENAAKSELDTVKHAVKPGNETILVVEDEESVRKIIEVSLKKLGYQIFEAENGKKALEIFKDKAQQIDLLITDVIMPEMNGNELAQKIKKIKPDIKVLYLSGYTDDLIVEKGVLKMDINFMQKPFSIQQLSQKVRQIMES